MEFIIEYKGMCGSYIETSTTNLIDALKEVTYIEERGGQFVSVITVCGDCGESEEVDVANILQCNCNSQEG